MNELLNNGWLQFGIVFFLLFVLVTWIFERRMNSICDCLSFHQNALRSMQIQLDVDANLDDLTKRALAELARRLSLLIEHLGVIGFDKKPDHSPEPFNEDPECEKCLHKDCTCIGEHRLPDGSCPAFVDNDEDPKQDGDS